MTPVLVADANLVSFLFGHLLDACVDARWRYIIYCDSKTYAVHISYISNPAEQAIAFLANEMFIVQMCSSHKSGSSGTCFNQHVATPAKEFPDH